MRRSGVARFPNSIQLFKFCQKILSEKKGSKVHDQDVGAILQFNPSDCSHWKRGEKNVKSVFSLAQLAESLDVEVALLHDIAIGVISLEEAYYEYHEANQLSKLFHEASVEEKEKLDQIRQTVDLFVQSLHHQAEFTTPPLYLPEIIRFFPFVGTQPVDMMDKLSRILRIKHGQYMVQFKKTELKPQIRMSIAKDLSRIIFEVERERFPELGEGDSKFYPFEEIMFVANLLVPKSILLKDLQTIDSKRNLVSELAANFWAPKLLVNFQLQEVMQNLKVSSMAVDTSKTSATKDRDASLI